MLKGVTIVSYYFFKILVMSLVATIFTLLTSTYLVPSVCVSASSGPGVILPVRSAPYFPTPGDVCVPTGTAPHWYEPICANKLCISHRSCGPGPVEDTTWNKMEP
jgi:hypothetical protein